MWETTKRVDCSRAAISFVCAVNLALACGVIGCTGRSNQGSVLLKAPANDAVGADFSTENQPSVDPLYELSQLHAPPGVDAELWNRLTAEFTQQWEKVNEHDNEGLPVFRSISTPPNTNRSQAVLVHIGEETRWGYYSNGDYDQNSEVNIADLTPLAVHFGEAAPPTGFPPGSIQAVIDGDGNGEINLADITPIAVNYFKAVSEYYIYGSENDADYPQSNTGPNGAGAVLADTVEFLSATGDPAAERLQFSIQLDHAFIGNYIWARPSDGVDEGTPSTMSVPYSPPLFALDGYIFMAGGGNDPLPGVPVTLSGDASGDTVTDETGRYLFEHLRDGDYTVTPTGDPYGYTPGSIDAEISFGDERLESIYPSPVDIVHTWETGLDADCTAEVIALDWQSNAYLAGSAGSNEDTKLFVLKYDLQGNLLWNITKQFGFRIACQKLLIDAGGNIYVGGYYKTSAVIGAYRNSDIFILKLDSLGNEAWVFTYTTPLPTTVEGERGYNLDFLSGFDFDADGNLTLACHAGGDYSSVFQLEVSQGGVLLQEKYFAGDMPFDRQLSMVGDAVFDTQGSVIHGGSLTSMELGPGGFAPAFIMKIDADGEVPWAFYWGTEYYACRTSGLHIGPDDSIYTTTSFEIEQYEITDIQIANISAQGELLWETQVATGTHLWAPTLVVDSFGMSWVGMWEHNIESVSPFHSDPFLISLDPNGEIRFARKWETDELVNSGLFNDLEISKYGVAVLCGQATNRQGSWMTPEITVDSPQHVYTSQDVVPLAELGTANTVEITDLNITGEEDFEDENDKCLIMFYRP